MMTDMRISREQLWNYYVRVPHMCIHYPLDDVVREDIRLGEEVVMYVPPYPNPIRCVFLKILGSETAVFYPLQALN
jgi:hypothetical protein